MFQSVMPPADKAAYEFEPFPSLDLKGLKEERKSEKAALAVDEPVGVSVYEIPAEKVVEDKVDGTLAKKIKSPFLLTKSLKSEAAKANKSIVDKAIAKVTLELSLIHI